MIFGTKELYIFRLLAPFERSMDRRIISLSDDPSMTSRLGLYKVTWWSGHRTLFQHVIKLRYDQFLFIIDFGDNNETLLSFLFRIIGRIIRLFTESVVPNRTVHRHTSSTVRWFRIFRWSSMHSKPTNKWSVILTVTIPFGSGLPKGKNFTCNVFIISTHFSPLEWWLLIALRSTWPHLKCQIIIILDF